MNMRKFNFYQNSLRLECEITLQFYNFIKLKQFNLKGNFADLVNQEAQKKKYSAQASEFSLQYKGEKQETPSSNRSNAFPQSQFGQVAQQSKDVSPTCMPIKLPQNSETETDITSKMQRSEKELQSHNIINNSEQNVKSDKNLPTSSQQIVKSENKIITTSQSITKSDNTIQQQIEGTKIPNLQLGDGKEEEVKQQSYKSIKLQETTPKEVEHEDNLQDELEQLNKMLEMKKQQKKKTLIMQTQEIETIHEDKDEMQTGTAVDKRKNNEEQNGNEAENDVFNFSKEPDFNLTSPDMKSANPPPIFSMDTNQQKQNMHLSFNQLGSQNSAENINSKRNLNDQKDKSISQIAHNQSEDFSQLGIENELLNQQASQNQIQDPDDNLSNLNDFSSPNPLTATPGDSAQNSYKKQAQTLKNVVKSKVISQLRSAGGLNSKNPSTSSLPQKSDSKTGSSTQITQKTTTVTTTQPKTSSYLAKRQATTVAAATKSKTEPSNLNTSLAKATTTKLKSQQSLNVGSATNLNKSLVGNKSMLNPNNTSNSEIKQNSYTQLKASAAATKSSAATTVTRTPLKGSTLISKTSTSSTSGPSSTTTTTTKTEGTKGGTVTSVVKTTTTTAKSTSSYSQQAAKKAAN